MKEKMLNKKILVIIGICIIAIIGIIIYLNQKGKEPLFISSYKNDSWGQQDYGYIIYSNGTIEEYDYYNKDKELKKEKISNGELNQLKTLANLIKDEYEKDISAGIIYGAGTYSKKIYNKKMEKWIELWTYGDTIRKNSSKESKEILELIENIENKFLK